MGKTKVYIDRLPECCFGCPLNNEVTGCRLGCKLNSDEQDIFYYSENRDKNCPLIDIKTHDNEILEKERERAFVLYSTLYDVLEKQGNENIASMIDQLTMSNYSDLCDLYKTAKTIEIRDKATAFMATNEVIDEIRSDLRSGLKKFKPKPDDALTQFIYDLDNKLDKIDKKNREWSV